MAAESRERPALRVSLFETDMGELLFSGLTPNLPLMDRPPNSRLLQAHSGAARSKGSPLSFSFGKEIDQSTVCQAHCQGLLRNQTARFPKQRYYTNGYLWNTCSALQTQTSTSVLRWLKCDSSSTDRKKGHALLFVDVQKGIL